MSKRHGTYLQKRIITHSCRWQAFLTLWISSPLTAWNSTIEPGPHPHLTPISTLLTFIRRCEPVKCSLLLSWLLTIPPTWRMSVLWRKNGFLMNECLFLVKTRKNLKLFCKINSCFNAVVWNITQICFCLWNSPEVYTVLWVKQCGVNQFLIFFHLCSSGFNLLLTDESLALMWFWLFAGGCLV